MGPSPAKPPIGANVFANGIRQHYLRFGGQGDPLVIVPGITSPAATWGFVAERLAEHNDVFVIDVRGRGLSSSGMGLDYGLQSLADDLRGFVAALGLSKATILGHSMGARIAARASLLDDDRFGRVFLVDPPVSGPGRREYPSKLPWYTVSIEQAQNGMDANAMRAFCPTWSDEQLALRAEWLHTCHRPAVENTFRSFHEDDFHADLARMKVPAGLMVAGRGGVIEPADVEEIRDLVPGIVVVHVPNAGHMIPWDDLPGFLDAFKLLAKVVVGGAAR